MYSLCLLSAAAPQSIAIKTLRTLIYILFLINCVRNCCSYRTRLCSHSLSLFYYMHTPCEIATSSLSLFLGLRGFTRRQLL